MALPHASSEVAIRKANLATTHNKSQRAQRAAYRTCIGTLTAFSANAPSPRGPDISADPETAPDSPAQYLLS